MDKYEEFKKEVECAAHRFQDIDKKEIIRLVSHLDCDGISAAAILIKTLNRENMRYSVSIVQQLNKRIVNELAREDFKYYIFSDIGSGNIIDISERFRGKTVFILDHHEPQDSNWPQNIVHINPHVFDIDGSKEISGSGVVYLFSKSLSEKNKNLAHIAIIGAIGDVQEKNGFLKLNDEILKDAVAKEKISVEKGLRCFGFQTRPIHKVLEYSTDPYIPGVSGSESGAIQFLNQIGIDPKDKSGWKKLVNLSDGEMKKLVTGIVMKRLNETSPEDVLGSIYLLTDEEEESPTKDAKEFSTLLNACGRLDKASIGIGACIGDKRLKKRAIDVLSDYKKEIMSSINWFHENQKSDLVFAKDGFIIINAKDHVRSTMIGTLASILSKSNEFSENTLILSMAYSLEDTVKASLRVSGRENKDLDLIEIMRKITSLVPGAECGGHKNAAGAVIPIEMEDQFISASRNILANIAIEERVVS